MNTKQLNRIFARTMYVMVIAVLVFSVTGSALADEPAPPRIYAGLTDDSIRYELTAPYASVTFSIYASEGGDLLSEITKDADETGFVWISIWEHRQELKPGTFIVVGDETHTNKLVVQEVSIDIVNAEENILSGKAPAGSIIWVVANNEPDRCGISVEAASDNTWQFDFDDLGCDISADMVFYAQVMDVEGDTSEANPDFIDGWHDGAEGVGHPNSCNVTGFATDTDDRDRDLQIRVLSDGSEIASTLANGFWDGFIGECGQDGTCSFYINLWGLEGFSLYQQHEITVQAYDVETEQWQNLGGTPRLLTCANYDLYIFDTKTGKAERLTTNLPNTGEYNPSWSNNGKQIVHDVADADGHGLYITDVKTKISMPLEGGDGGNDASWSPNGKWIVFDRRWYDDPNLYLLPPKGGTPTLVVSNATNGDWSPDSQRLVFERDGGLWTASVNGGDEQQIVEAGYGPAWSPDGLWIAYDLDGDIWKIAVDEFGARAGDPIQLTSGPVSEGGATWSQNGAFIVFASDATGDHDIWQIAAEGGVPAQLRGAIGYGDYDPDYSNNGEYIAYEGAMEPSVPHVESDTWLNTYALADWPVGQLINVSIDDPGTSKKPDYRTSFTPDGTSNWYMFQPGLDVQPGFVITAKSKFFTKTLIVSNLATTDVNAGSGMVSGVATPNNSFYMVADGDHFRLPSGQGVSVDENGNWTADFSGAEAPRPWTWYTGGEMFEWDVDGDMTHAFWHLHQEVIEVWLPYNEIRAFDWPLNTNLKFYVDGDEIATALTEPTVWMNGTWAVVNTGDLQLQPGMMITVTDGVTTKDMIIQDIKITKIDADNDLVYGYGPADANLELGSWEDSPVFRFFNADGDGNWVVDYRTPSVNGVTVDLNPGDDIRLFARDAEKDATVWEAITYPPLYLRVNYGHDWMESFYEAGHEVVITVTNSEGAEKATATVFTEPKDFWGGQAGFQTAPEDWSPALPDIQPYDWVYARVDNGATAQVQIGDISGALDLNTDSIEGTINAPWFSDPVQVECLDWGSGQEPPFGNKDGGFVPTNGEYPYSCSWYGEWDIQPGQNVGVGYFGPDGHWVANAFYVRPLFLYIHYEYPDVVEGDYELGHTVQVTVFDSEWSTKATATVDTMEMPHWGGAPGFRVEQWDGIEGPPDIQPGDVVRAIVDDGFLTTEARIGEIAATIDLDANSITGTIDAPWAGDLVTVSCSPWGAPQGASDKETTVVPDGISEFTCTWDSEWDIQPGETVGVGYWSNDLHWITNAFFEPATIVVNTTADVIDNDGYCTLREAIIAANTNSPSGEASGECPAGLDFVTDTILLAADQTYSLTISGSDEDGAYTGDLDILDNSAATDLIIMVEGNGSATVSQNASVDDRVLENHGATVQIEGLTLTGGSSVDLGGGVLNTGTLTINVSEINGNMANRGGGLFNDSGGTLTLINSLVSGNSANIDGGGIWNFGALIVDASKISMNSATYGGGGLFNYEGKATIQNHSLIGEDWSEDNNSANYGGGIAIWSGNLNLKNSSVSGNKASWDGGGIFNGNDGTLIIESSSFGGNSAENAGGVILNAGVFTMESSYIQTNFAQFGGGLYNTDTGKAELVDTEISDNSAPSNGGGIENHGTLTISSSIVSWNSTQGSGGGILNFGVVTIQSSSEINDNYAGWAGGGIFNTNSGTLTADSSSISNNISAVFGGGIMNQGMLTVSNSEIRANSTPVKGGGITNEGTLTVEKTILSANTAGQGGGLYNFNFGSALIRDDTVIEGNSAGSGGGLFNTSTMTVENSTVSGNHATDYGGGLFNWIGGTLIIDNTAVSNNSANEGGGLHNKEGSTATIKNGSIFSSNYAELGVGGIQNWGTITITGSVLRENTSPGDGDAITNSGPEGSTASVTASCIVGNGNTAVTNVWSVVLNFTGNWWGDASGPSGAGAGSGDSVGVNIDFSGWLDTAPDICAPK